jgi:phage terminase small subunit
MPVLASPRHERFAQALAAGTSRMEAYRLAGYKIHASSAGRLARRADVAARVQEITGRAAVKAEITAARVLRELANIAFANMLDFMSIGDDGKPSVNFSALTHDKAAAIQEIIVETAGGAPAAEGADAAPGAATSPSKRARARVVKVRFKLADKKAALYALARHLALFKQAAEEAPLPSGQPPGPEMSDLEVARRIAFLLRKGVPNG